jgi:hypothetical protein
MAAKSAVRGSFFRKEDGFRNDEGITDDFMATYPSIVIVMG